MLQQILSIHLRCLALLIGDGAASGFSIALGMNEKKNAEKFVGNGLTVLVSVSLILCIIGFIFRKGILSLFGANLNRNSDNMNSM